MKGKVAKMRTFASVLAIFLATACLFCFVACGGNGDPTPPPDGGKDDVAVTEVILELDKASARVGETIGVTVTMKPNNATDKSYSLSTNDESVAKVTEDGTSVECLSAGTVIVTARSKSTPAKKAEATLTVLGTDESGRYENLFEAEDATQGHAEGSTMHTEYVTDDRLSGTGVVGTFSKGDRLIWGFEASEADDNAALRIRLMGPSGWLGMWDSIPYTFADWYTVKVNGKTIDTENIRVEGTANQGAVADYYAVKDVELGGISLQKGLNVITFVISNRFDVTSINEGIYNGNISCLGNVDSITVLSSKDLTFVENTEEVENPDPDVAFASLKMEAEAEETRVYESADVPKADLSGKTFAEFKENMNVMFGMNADTAKKVRFTLRVASPYKTTAAPIEDVALSDMISLTLNGKKIDLGSLTVRGCDEVNTKENFTELTTGWTELSEGENVLNVVAKKMTGYAYLGGLDFVVAEYVSGEVAAQLVEEPQPQTTVRLEAEAETTKLVGYTLADGATSVEFKDAYKVETDKYVNKLETNKIIFGIEADQATYATIKLRVAAPYINAQTAAEDVSLGSIGDLWVNGVMVSTPEIVRGNGALGDKENYTEVEIETQIELRAGKNRIVWEAQNYTDKDYEFLGALDYIELTSSASLTAYEVNFWTDRNSYFDDGNNEPIWVTCDAVSESTPDNCWIAVYRVGDAIEENSVGSLYYYYPTNAKWNTDGAAHLGDRVNILTQNPNSERPLIDATTGGMYLIVYFEWDGKNAQNGYTITDYVTIGVWDDPGLYGGYVEA